MSDFPHGGGVAQTRAWLDKKDFQGFFEGWEADCILALERSDFEEVLSMKNNIKVIQLWSFLSIARARSGNNKS